jgi:hypothetical protein
VLRWVAKLYDLLEYVQRKPSYGDDQSNLNDKQEVYVAQIEIISEDHNAQKVNNSSQEQSQEHLSIKPIDLSIHI